MNQVYRTVQQVIRTRKTEKVLGDPANPVVYSPEQLSTGDQIVKQAICDSGYAPFHFDRRLNDLAEPWRVYWMDCGSCRRLARALPQLIPDMKPGNKLPSLLSGCGSLTLYTWLPNEAGRGEQAEKFERINREHLAATAAAVQNFLLLLTAQEIRNYWASGTLFADHLFDTLGIPQDSELTAAVFASYPHGTGDRQIISGKLREQRSVNHAWMSEIRYS